MSSDLLVLDLKGRGYVSATEVQVVDSYGTEIPMRISTTNVDFDALTIGGVAIPSVAELGYIDIATLGTGAASKAVVLDASGDYTYPASATIVHPSGATETHSSGSTLNIAGTFQVGGVAVTTTAAELNVLAGVAATLTAAELSILDGVTSTAAELNSVDLSLNTETIAEGGTVSVTKVNTKVASTGAGAITIAAPDATMLGKVKTIEMISGEHDVTLALTNVQGGSAGTTATFSDTNDCLVLVGGTSKWHVVGESGVVLS